MGKKYSTTKTQSKADRYIRAAKGQIRTKAEKRVHNKYMGIIRNNLNQIKSLKRTITILQKKLAEQEENC